MNHQRSCHTRQGDSPAERRRVPSRIGGHVREYFASIAVGQTFRLEDLRRHVVERVGTSCPIAPERPGRIMRGLRRAGQIDYEVVSRSGSLYRRTA